MIDLRGIYYHADAAGELRASVVGNLGATLGLSDSRPPQSGSTDLDDPGRLERTSQRDGSDESGYAFTCDPFRRGMEDFIERSQSFDIRLRDVEQAHPGPSVSTPSRFHLCDNESSHT